MASSTPSLKPPPAIKKSSQYPSPLIVPSLTTHAQTFIILHGRGSSGASFGPALLAHPIPEYGTLRLAFSAAKFIFPTASKRRAACFNRTPITQWFDNWYLDETPLKREELQIEGLRETTAYIHGLMRDAINDVGAGNVVLAGLSQGCAAALVALLTWDKEVIGGMFGMCGWLPFGGEIEKVAMAGEAIDCGLEDEHDPFARSCDGDTSPLPLDIQALRYLYEELDLPSMNLSPSCLKIPIFVSHGNLDDKVGAKLGRQAVSCLSTLGLDTMYKEYKNLGHWYSGDMLADIVAFLKKA